MLIRRPHAQTRPTQSCLRRRKTCRALSTTPPHSLSFLSTPHLSSSTPCTTVPTQQPYLPYPQHPPLSAGAGR